MLRIFSIVAAAMFLAACSTTLQPGHLDAKTGAFPTQSKIDADGVQTQTPFDPRYAGMLYVMTDSKVDKYNDFFVQSFNAMGVFQSVTTKGQLESLVIQKNLTDKVPSVSDLVGLNRLAKQIGPFLVVEPQIDFLGGYNFSASFTVTDASTGQVVLKIKNSAFNWAGLDEPLFYPLFNAFLEWAKGQPIETEPPKSGSK